MIELIWGLIMVLSLVFYFTAVVGWPLLISITVFGLMTLTWFTINKVRDNDYENED